MLALSLPSVAVHVVILQPRDQLRYFKRLWKVFRQVGLIGHLESREGLKAARDRRKVDSVADHSAETGAHLIDARVIELR